MALTIYDRYGGFATIRRVVSSFYDKVLDSTELAPYFEKVEMRRLIDHQTRFIASVTGGPASYTDDHLRRIHAPMQIHREHFLALVTLLRETLEDMDFEAADVAYVERQLLDREIAIVSHA